MDIHSMTLEEIWEELVHRANEKPEILDGIKATYSFDITGDDGAKYGLIVQENKIQVVDGGIDNADCSMKMSVEYFKRLIQGNLNATTAYMTGKLKVKGNLGLGLKLESLLKKFQLN